MTVGTFLHPDAEQLTAFAEGRLGGQELSLVEAHLNSCDRCCTEIDRLLDASLTSRLRESRIVGADTPPTSGATPFPQSALTTPDEPHVPEELATHPRYRVLRPLGSGGMGAVYLAEHLLMNRLVALKVIRGDLTSNPAALERFRREAAAAACLDHPNIVRAFDAEQAGAGYVLAMEYVEGTSLAQLVRERGPIAVHQACTFVSQAAQALQHAYERGLVHRDIKPSNLMLTPDGQLKILDFGLARLLSENEQAEALTQSGMVVGTVDYMAPEQARSPHQADVRADIYSLGCTLYFLLTGQAPFSEGNAIERLMAHAERVPRPLTVLRPDVPPALARVIERMMTKDPARRYQTPAEVFQALAPFLKSPAAPPRRRRRLAGALGLLAVSLVLATVIYVATNKGTVRIEVDDPHATVSVNGAVITIDKLGEPITLRVGEHELFVKRGDLVVETRKFTIQRGQHVALRVELLPRASAGSPKAVEPDKPFAQEWTDVLPLIDLSRHRVSGSWRREGTDVLVDPQDWSRLAIPVVPEGNYELRITLTRTQGAGEINFHLPVGDTCCMASVGGGDAGWHGLQLVDGDRVGKEHAGAFVNGQRHTVFVKLFRSGEEVAIRLDLDGKPLLRWSGPRSALSLRNDWRLYSTRNSLGLGAHNEAVVFHKVELRMTSGQARLLEEPKRVKDVAAGEWVDVLSMVDLRSHHVLGDWQWRGNELLARGGEFSRVIIPVVPEGSYELKARLTRTEGSGEDNILLPVGNTSCMLSVPSGPWVGLQSVGDNGRGTSRKDLAAGELQNGREVAVHIKVSLQGDKVTITARLDGKLLIDWQGPRADLTCRDSWLLHPRALGLGVHNDTVIFHSVQLRVLDGKAPRLLWGEDKAGEARQP